ncbi:M1 family peptidase [Nibribacter ruber]|uniref:Aminopeptidase N n=1 Tax=Nibribacter ruber TaxID=2698458 RepID=A0A6P1P2S6_9BACT|nr:M1 family metallopeptidase [Nibribacter ruber]QHL88707.1 M1 family peptidase [Nibribacter ruber]
MNHILSRSFLVLGVSLFLGGCAAKKPSALVAASEETALAIDTTALLDSVMATMGPKTSNGPYQPAAERKVDLLHTRLAVQFNWAKQQLMGEATLTLKPYFYPQTQVVLDAKGFDIHKVEVRQGKTVKALPYTYNQKQITIQLGKAYTRQDTLQLFIAYTAKPTELKITGSDAIVADQGLYFINPSGTEKGMPQQIWTQGETESSSCWFPTIDKPNERMTQEIFITIEDKFKTLSNGRLVSSKKGGSGLRTDHWKLDLPHAPYLAMMAIGEFAVVKDNWRGKEVSYWVEPAYAGTAKATFGRTPAMLEFFSQKLGVTFPWDKYAQVVVRNFVSGAMENTTASTFMEAVQQDRRELLDKNWDHIIAHELFHQWFGDYVTIESWANLPLNESFADYSEYLWAEHQYGPEEAALTHQDAFFQYLQEARSKQEPLIRYNYLDKEDMFDSHSYAKGGRVLHMLRKLVGDDAFFASLNLYLKDNKFTSVEVDELRMAFEDVTGQDLQWFFNQWFLSPGHPVLKVDKWQEGDSLKIRVAQQQDSITRPVYRLPITIETYSQGKGTRWVFEMNSRVDTFSLAATVPVEAVVIDPEQELLAQIVEEKTPQEWEKQFLNSPAYAAKSVALFHLIDEKTVTDIAMNKALADPFWKIRTLGLETLIDSDKLKESRYQNQVLALAQQDKNSQVRATAIYVLSTASDLPFASYEMGLQDSSYQVVGASIFAYAKAKGPVERLKQFLGYKNPEVVNALAASFTESTEEEMYDWYLQNSLKLKNENLYYFMQSFGAFLLRKNIDDQERGWQALLTIIDKEKVAVVKQSAFQMLLLLTETEDRKQEVAKVLEKHPDLADWMADQQ